MKLYEKIYNDIKLKINAGVVRYPDVKVISTEKAFMLMRQFGFEIEGHELIEVAEGDTFSFGGHTEKGKAVIIGANPVQIFCYFSYAMHKLRTS